MSVIEKITLFEHFTKNHKFVTPLYVVKYKSGAVTAVYDFASLPKQAKKIIKTWYYSTGYNRKCTALNGTFKDLHITEYEREKP